MLLYTILKLGGNWRLWDGGALFIPSKNVSKTFLALHHCMGELHQLHSIFRLWEIPMTHHRCPQWWVMGKPDICRVSHALELTPSVGKVFVMAAAFSCPLMTSPSINLTAPLDNPGSPWPGWPHHLVVTGCLWHKGSRTPQSDKEMQHM